MAGWSTPIQLVGAGGEPVDFARTLLSHGVADLPPNEIAPDGTLLSTVLTVGEGAWVVELSSDGAGRALLSEPATAPPTALRALCHIEIQGPEPVIADNLNWDPTAQWRARRPPPLPARKIAPTAQLALF